MSYRFKGYVKKISITNRGDFQVWFDYSYYIGPKKDQFVAFELKSKKYKNLGKDWDFVANTNVAHFLVKAFDSRREVTVDFDFNNSKMRDIQKVEIENE